MKIISATVISIISLAISACNTVEGFGKDVQHAGNSIEKAAK